MIGSFAELMRKAETLGPRPLVVAAAQEQEVLKAVSQARERGLCWPVLVGDADRIGQSAEQAGVSIQGMEIKPAADDSQAARLAVELVRQQENAVLMKGYISSRVFLQAVLDGDRGLRSGRVVSHVALIEAPGYHRLFFLTDAALNIAPDLQRKADILMNAAAMARYLGWECPRTALVCAVETVNPDMPATVEAACLTQMSRRGQLGRVEVDGPLGLDNAVSSLAARIKGLTGPVAGQADILLVPGIETGNVFYKCLHLFCPEVKLAAIVNGAAAPVVLTSRADSEETRFRSIALGVVLS